MGEVAGSKAFQNGSSVGEATDMAAIVDGVWDSEAAKDALGDSITPEEVLDCIQEAVTIALSNFVRDICEDMRKMTKFSEKSVR
jgi:hypothetical protein